MHPLPLDIRSDDDWCDIYCHLADQEIGSVDIYNVIEDSCTRFRARGEVEALGRALRGTRAGLGVQAASRKGKRLALGEECGCCGWFQMKPCLRVAEVSDVPWGGSCVGGATQHLPAEMSDVPWVGICVGGPICLRPAKVATRAHGHKKPGDTP